MIFVVRAVVIIFGVGLVAFSVFWARKAAEARRSGEWMTLNARAILLTRMTTYFVAGMFFIMLGIFRSQWLAWVAITGLVAKPLLESWFRRRARRGGEATGNPDLGA